MRRPAATLVVVGLDVESLMTDAVAKPGVVSDVAVTAGSRHSSNGRDVRLRDPAVSDVGGMVFDAMLRTSQALTGTRTGGFDERISPAQMFEPPSGEGRTERRLRSAEEYRSGGAGHSWASRYDRTSIDARREAGANLTNAMHTSESWKDGFPMGGGSEPRSGATGDYGVQASGADQPTPGESLHGGAAAPRADTRAVLGQTSLPVFANPPGAGRVHGLDAHGIRAMRGGGQARTDGVGSPGTAKGFSARGAAFQLGQLLAAGRSGDADAGRAASFGASPVSTSEGASRSANGSRSSDTLSASTRTPGHLGRSDGAAESTRDSVFGQLVRSIRLNTAARHSSARLRLHPPELGRIDVRVEVRGERVRIDVRTETDAARYLLQERGADLASAMERQGISVERFDVTVDSATARYGEADAPGPNDHSAMTDTERDGGTPRSDSGEWEDGLESPLAWDVGSEPVAVAETRLDIRV